MCRTSSTPPINVHGTLVLSPSVCRVGFSRCCWALNSRVRIILVDLTSCWGCVCLAAVDFRAAETELRCCWWDCDRLCLRACLSRDLQLTHHCGAREQSYEARDRRRIYRSARCCMTDCRSRDPSVRLLSGGLAVRSFCCLLKWTLVLQHRRCTLWVKKTGPGPFSFKHNFRKNCPILTILSLLQT